MARLEWNKVPKSKKKQGTVFVIEYLVKKGDDTGLQDVMDALRQYGGVSIVDEFEIQGYEEGLQVLASREVRDVDD